MKGGHYMSEAGVHLELIAGAEHRTHITVTPKVRRHGDVPLLPRNQPSVGGAFMQFITGFLCGIFVTGVAWIASLNRVETPYFDRGGNL
jgi:hypothetical protein